MSLAKYFTSYLINIDEDDNLILCKRWDFRDDEVLQRLSQKKKTNIFFRGGNDEEYFNLIEMYLLSGTWKTYLNKTTFIVSNSELEEGFPECSWNKYRSKFYCGREFGQHQWFEVVIEIETNVLREFMEEKKLWTPPKKGVLIRKGLSNTQIPFRSGRELKEFLNNEFLIHHRYSASEVVC